MNHLLMFVQRRFETSSKQKKWTAALTFVGLLSTVALFSANGGSQTSGEPLGSTPLYFAGALTKLVVVLLMIVASALLARRWLQPGMGGKTMRQMRLMESLRLSPKQALHLISVGNRQFLIGATDQNVAVIAQVERGFETAVVETSNAQPALDFGSVLQSFSINLPGSSSK